MFRATTRRHARALAAPLVAGLVALLVLPAGRGRADDRDLLRTGTAKPYLFILLDTSASMNLKLGTGGWTPGGADSPGSRLYQAKQALYDVLKDADDVQFGFASYNQDNVYASAKHWIYYTTAALPTSGWDLNFPRPDADGLTGCPDVRNNTSGAAGADGVCDDDDLDGNPDTDILVDDVDGDVLTWGPRFTTGITNPGLAGTCASPLNLSVATDRQKVQSFAIDKTLTSVNTNTTTGNPGTVAANAAFWVKPSNGGSTYRLGVVGVGVLGTGTLAVTFTLERLTSNCNANPRVFATPPQVLVRTFQLDPHLNQVFLVDKTASTGNPNTREAYAALWDVEDTHSSADFGTDHPFTGKGWEGNYDSDLSPAPHTGIPAGSTDADPYCTRTGSGSYSCQSVLSSVKPVQSTVYSGTDRALDTGDMLPFHWSIDNRDAFLRRLAPNHSSSGVTTPEFRNAPYFQTVGTNPLPLVNPAVRPIFAVDKSPLAKSINDFRCWYLGKEGHGATGKCRNSAFFDLGWESVACANDSEFGCRRPYLIIISDGEDNIQGEDATADVAAMFNHSSVKTWALNLGNPASCNSGGGLHPIVQVGGCAHNEECCITVSTRAGLAAELQRILGLIRTEVRSFASAAVPSVQASVEQKVFFTNFVPFNDSSVWDGHVHGFIKPVPLDEITGRPLFDQNCDGSGTVDTASTCYDGGMMQCECHLWDAGQLLKDSQYDASDPLDLTDPAKRRVFYSVARGTEAGQWPKSRRLFDPTNTPANQPGMNPDQNIRYDLWSGLAIDYVPDETPDPDAVDTTAQTEANRVITHTLGLKTGTLLTGTTPQPITFLMGDVFHSTPQVIGTPTNTLYFAQDLNGNGQPCANSDNDMTSGNPGYRCFFRRQANRRKLLMVGSDDGMVHVFDAGLFHRGGPGVPDAFTGKILNEDLTLNGEFDNGSGHELFSYVPRTVMPTLTQLAGSNRHHYAVDGTLRAADVFIDPVKDSSAAAFPDPDDREWRTVAIGGLREGGRGYYALDVTQPDPVTCKAIDGSSAADCTNDTRAQGFYVTGDFNLDPTRDPSLPRCLGDASNVPPANCGPTPFPSSLWDFDDSILDTTTGIRYQLDEDDNGIPDLGPTWSLPNLGRIRVCQPGGTLCNPDVSSNPTNDDHLVDRYVAIFGGGMDVASKATPEAATLGNWLYMVDIETGQVIYKRRLVGAAPSEPAAVDTDQDGYIDRVYLGTIAGKLFRVDLGRDVDGNLPVLTPTTVKGLDPGGGAANAALPALRIPVSVTDSDDVVHPIWTPGVLFDTRRAIGSDDPATVPYRPLYERPSVIFVAKLGLYALAFGTGDREDLWSTLADSGRFYVFVDDVAHIENLITPKTEAGLRPIDPDTTANDLTEDFLLDPSFRGWVLDLHDNERVITDSFALAGVTIFSSFIPKIVDDDGEVINVGCSGGGTGGGGGGPAAPSATCSRLGDSQIFVVNTTNANGFLIDSSNVKTRYRVVANFVTNPFAEPGQSKRTSGSTGDEPPGHTADDLTPNLREVMETLKGLFPANCKFANYRIDIKTIAADTSLEFIAPVPVCIIERNWKEF